MDPLRDVKLTPDPRTGHVVAIVPVLDGPDVQQEFDFPNPTLWSPETPKLYEAVVRIGEDARTVSFGFRTVEFRNGKFCLNGKERQIRGVCRHQDRAGKGWAVSAADEEEDVKWIKAMGADPMPEGRAETLVRETRDLFRHLDPTRPTVAASNDPRRKELNAIPDALGLNLYPLWYDIKELYAGGMQATVARSVGMNRRPAICVSEYGGSACIDQHDDPLVRPESGGRFHPEEYQAWMHAQLYRDLAGNPQVWGSFLWQMFDCGSDCRQEGSLPGLNEKGLVTFDRKTAKDAFCFYKANWNPEPMLHLVGSRLTETTNSAVTVCGFCNAGSVTLTVNGRVIGTQVPDKVKCVVWRDVSLTQGDNRIVLTCEALRAAAVWKR